MAIQELEFQSDHFGKIKIACDPRGVAIYIEGHGRLDSIFGAPIYLDLDEALVYPRLLVWGDINEEDWTDEITLGGSLEERLIEANEL